MRALSKPLSSPGRAEKFPPSLMRFLKSNASSRSRGRSRASPIFYRRSRRRPPGGAIETTQEPSSPKVTCIGQVRVRRKKNSASASNRRRRFWLSGAISCEKFPCKFPKSSLGRFFRRCGSIFSPNCCREIDLRVYSDRKFGENENCAVDGDDNSHHHHHNRNRNSFCSNDSETDCYRNKKHEEIEGDGFQGSKREVLKSSSSSLPPKNALLLTRCRSAPPRSYSLGGRFLAEEKGKIISHGNENEGEKTEKLEKPRCEKSADEENCEEIGKKIEGLKKVDNIAISVHPLLLTRCKSEPARRGERLGVETAVEKGQILKHEK